MQHSYRLLHFVQIVKGVRKELLGARLLASYLPYKAQMLHHMYAIVSHHDIYWTLFLMGVVGIQM